MDTVVDAWLVPAPLLTVTSTLPTSCAGATAASAMAPSAVVTLVNSAGTEPTMTRVAPARFTPVMVIVVPAVFVADSPVTLGLPTDILPLARTPVIVYALVTLRFTKDQASFASPKLPHHLPQELRMISPC